MEKLTITFWGIISILGTLILKIPQLFLIYLFFAVFDLIFGIAASRKKWLQLSDAERAENRKNNKANGYFNSSKMKNGLLKIAVMLFLILAGHLIDKIHFEFINFSAEKIMFFAVIMYEGTSIYENLKFLGFDIVQMIKKAFGILKETKELIK